MKLKLLLAALACAIGANGFAAEIGGSAKDVLIAQVCVSSAEHARSIAGVADLHHSVDQARPEFVKFIEASGLPLVRRIWLQGLVALLLHPLCDPSG